ncbi:saccharopine dehydrogenase NADP-binding domain-containing protein [Saccharothrix violaceirubra]
MVLGGCGITGSVAARVAATLPGVDVVVADRVAGADVRLDVTDPAALREALRDTDVVLNTVGPFLRFGTTVLRAAIDTGTHYLDLCDDWQPTQDLLLLDDDARAAGVIAVVGMGASPGAVNLLARLAAARVGALTDLYVAWPADGKAEAGAALVHWMHQISGDIPAVRDGRLVLEPPLRAVDLPGGTAYTVGHPEPVTFHRAFRPRGDAATLMVASPTTIAYLDLVRRDIDAGRHTPESAARELVRPRIGRAVRAALRRPAGPGSLPPFFALARGAREVVVRLDHPWLLDDMGEATGLSLGLALAQVVNGTITGPGVHAPEDVVDPERFFADLARHHPAAVVR